MRPTGFRPPLLLTLANDALAANHVSAAYARTGATAPLSVAHRAEPANHCPRRKATSRTADPIPLRRFTNTTPRVRREFIQVDRDRSGNHRERAGLDDLGDRDPGPAQSKRPALAGQQRLAVGVLDNGADE